MILTINGWTVEYAKPWWEAAKGTRALRAHSKAALLRMISRQDDES